MLSGYRKTMQYTIKLIKKKIIEIAETSLNFSLLQKQLLHRCLTSVLVFSPLGLTDQSATTKQYNTFPISHRITFLNLALDLF